MKKYNFVFIYENKNRELENICLIAYCLNKKGYTTHFIETWHGLYHYIEPVEADVVITYACYDNSTIDFISNYVYEAKKIVNLQWEQVLTEEDENKLDKFVSIIEDALFATHISWGEKNKHRLINVSNVKENHICMAGHIALDFYNPILSGYYKTKEELEKCYPCIKNKKVYLYISSFADVAMPKEYLINFDDDIDETLMLREVNTKSQKEILLWLKKIMDERNDIAFIYRPHPSEANSEILNQFSKEIKNFYIIHDFSVQQWIVIADKIYTTYSTAISQVFAAKKGCQILRPYEIPKKKDVSIYANCKSISTFNEFKKTFDVIDIDFPIEKGIINKYYQNIDDLAYKKIVNFCINVYENDDYLMPNYKTNKELKGIKLTLLKIKNMMMIFYGKLYRINLVKTIIDKFSNRLRIKGEFLVHCDLMDKRNYTSELEINELIKKIGRIIELNEYDKR